MGTWGARAFENDGVADWFANLQDEARPAVVIKRAVTRVANAKPGKTIDLDDALEAVAAAELIAAARGHRGTGVPKPVTKWVAEQMFRADDALARSAAEAVRRVSNKSELRDEWDGDAAAWQRELAGLVERLGRSSVLTADKTSGKKTGHAGKQIDVDNLTVKQAVKALGIRMGWTDMSETGEPRGGLPNTSLNEKDLRLLARCTTLDGVGLYGKAVTSQCIALLEHLRLKWLRLCDVAAKDDVGPILERFGGLSELRLEGLKVTDRIIPHLSKLTKLKRLAISDCGVTAEGAKQLAKLLPGCDVTREE